jgi:opine dehydrogenase
MAEPNVGRRIAVIGNGGVALGCAVVLRDAGHHPVLWSPTGSPTVPTLRATGILPGEWSIEVAPDCATAVAGAEAVLVAVTANGHRAVMDAMAPHLQPGQVVIISAHCSFSALYLSKCLAERGVELPVAAWATTLVTGRRQAPGVVHISGRRARLDVATLPAELAPQGLAMCQELFGDVFTARDDMLAIMLSNLNPPAHMANMLLNLTRAECGETWPNYGSITPAVGRLMEALDVERLDLAAAFGLSVRTVQEHFVLSHGVAAASVGEMAQAVHAKRPELMGPKTLDTRFVTEDVPFGLLPLAMLGEVAGVAMPLHQAGISLFSAIYARDFAAENDLLPALGLARLAPAAVHARLRDGWSRA